MREIVLIIHNVRSCYNVGSLLRTSEGLGVKQVLFTGYTPYPSSEKDERLPHISSKIDKQIHKSALGAELMIPWEHIEDINYAIRHLKIDGYSIIALEQAEKSITLTSYSPTEKIAIIVGREVAGIEAEILKIVDAIVSIPMLGQKESFNVAQAAAMALYHFQYC